MLSFEYRKTNFEISNTAEWKEFLEKYNPSEDFIFSLNLPEEYFNMYVNDYLKIEI